VNTGENRPNPSASRTDEQSGGVLPRSFAGCGNDRVDRPGEAGRYGADERGRDRTRAARDRDRIHRRLVAAARTTVTPCPFCTTSTVIGERHDELDHRAPRERRAVQVRTDERQVAFPPARIFRGAQS
jgi:hypothetical protein